MSVPKQAQKLSRQLREVSEAVANCESLAEDPQIKSEAVLSALQEAQKQLQIADEQLSNVVGGI